MERGKYSLVVRVMRFDKRSKTRGKFVDRERFIEIIDSPEFKEQLDSGRLFGLFTHRSRSSGVMDRDIPYEDNIILSPDFCNVLRAIEVDGNDVYAGIDIFDTEAGIRVKDLITKKVNLGVSIAVRSRQNYNSFLVDEIMGIDFTMKPDLDAEIIDVNFSEDNNEVFNIQGNIKLVDSEVVLFSLTQFLQEMKRPPYMILRSRIQEVVQYCKSRSQKDIDKNSIKLRTYIHSYIYQWIQENLNNDNDVFNILLSLRLNTYLKDRRPAVELQRYFNRMKKQVKISGVIPREMQKKLNQSFALVISQVFDYINKKIETSGKVLK